MARRRVQRKGRGGNKKRTTVRAIFTAIHKYPRGTGASVREIHNVISKNDKGRSRRTLSSVKLAIARAIKMGSIRAPRGWSGFRGMHLGQSRNRRRQARRYGRKPHKTSSSKHARTSARRRSFTGGQSQRKSHVRRRRPFSKTRGKAHRFGRGARRRSRGARRMSRRMSRGARRMSRGARRMSRRTRSRSRRMSRGARRMSRGARRMTRGTRSRSRRMSRGARSRSRATRYRGRGRSQSRRPRRTCTTNSNNCCPANISDNYNSEEVAEDATSTSVWSTNTCLVS